MQATRNYLIIFNMNKQLLTSRFVHGSEHVHVYLNLFSGKESSYRHRFATSRRAGKSELA